MQRLNSVNPGDAEGRTRELLLTVEQAFGMVPNTARVMANSPAVLSSFLSFHAAMSDSRIGPQLLHQVKLATSEANTCSYCTSILCAVAPSVGLTADDIVSGRSAASPDARTNTALEFAKSVLENRGKVRDEQLLGMKDVGFDDAEIVEIVASVVLACFTNFLNSVANTELDIPRAEPVKSCTTGHCGAAVNAAC